MMLRTNDGPRAMGEMQRRLTHQRKRQYEAVTYPFMSRYKLSNSMPLGFGVDKSVL